MAKMKAFVVRESRKWSVELVDIPEPKEKEVLIKMGTMSLYESKESSGIISLKDLCNQKNTRTISRTFNLWTISIFNCKRWMT